MPSLKKARSLEIPCTHFGQGGHELVLFHLKASVLWKILSINRRIEDKDEGYQRSLSKARVISIAKYIDNGNTIPLSILVSFDKAEIILKDGKSFLKVPNKKDSGWIIDGQHRFAGAHEAKLDIELPVVAFFGLEIKEQINQFVTINKEAKGVPTSLYYDLLKHLPKKLGADIAKERAADIGAQLKRDEESPFYNKIVITTSPKKGELSLTNFVRKVFPLVQDGKGILHVYTEIEQRSIIANYYTALKNVFPKEYNKPETIFFQTLGFGALMNAFGTFFSICFRDKKGFTVADATDIFKKLDYMDFSNWYKMGTGGGAEAEAASEIITDLNSIFKIGNNKTGTIRV